jgi:hypothetical protein
MVDAPVQGHSTVGHVYIFSIIAISAILERDFYTLDPNDLQQANNVWHRLCYWMQYLSYNKNHQLQ